MWFITDPEKLANYQYKATLKKAKGDVAKQYRDLVRDDPRRTFRPILPDSLRSVKREGSRVSFHFSRHMGEGELLAKVISQNHVRDISITEPPIEEVVRDLYEGGENA